ncbi:MAG TPA: hypothetical protein VFD81_00640 [Methylomirabilota bacterium]|jgi:hypothetical protein|nr:hypothetical protein [Methylomirabilota bacterium]
MKEPDGTIVLILLAAGAGLLFLGLLAKILDLQLRRDGEAIAVRGLVADVLDQDPNPFGSSITIVRVRVPLWTGSPVTIRVAGQVSSDQLRKAVLESIRRAAKSELIVAIRIKSRIKVRPLAPSELRPARPAPRGRY